MIPGAHHQAEAGERRKKNHRRNQNKWPDLVAQEEREESSS